MSKNEFSSIEEAVQILSEGIVDITFVKKTDGSLRTMHSTLHKGYMPYGEYKTVDSVIVNSLESDGTSPLVVWDLHKSGWRSFYMGSTIEIQEVLPYGDTSAIMEDMIQQKSEGMDLSEKAREELLEGAVDMLKAKFAEALKDSPDKMAQFTVNKLKEIATNVIRHTLKI